MEQVETKVDVLAVSKEVVAETVAEQLRGTWHCNRVWEAWSIGTMGRNDFSPVDESDTPYDVADAILALPGLSALPELLRITRRLAALVEGLQNSNSSAEEAATRLAEEANSALARVGGGK